MILTTEVLGHPQLWAFLLITAEYVMHVYWSVSVFS